MTPPEEVDDDDTISQETLDELFKWFEDCTLGELMEAKVYIEKKRANLQ